MRTVLNSYLSMLVGETYLVLDSDKKEIGKLTVIDKGVSIMINDVETRLEENEVEKWFEENHYLISKVSPRWVEFNPNPAKNAKASDCTIRAYCAAEKLDWDAAYDIACKHGKDCASMPNDKNAIQDIVEHEFCYIPHKLSKDERDMTVEEFSIKYDVGTYLLMVARHLVAVVDGNYYDSWDSGKKKVRLYYSKD